MQPALPEEKDIPYFNGREGTPGRCPKCGSTVLCWTKTWPEPIYFCRACNLYFKWSVRADLPPGLYSWQNAQLIRMYQEQESAWLASLRDRTE